MINIQKLVEQATENGYQGDNALAKVCQDIVLKALATGPLSRNVKRWLDDGIDVITSGILEFVNKI